VALRGAAARRYAQAVFDIAKQTNTLDQWLADLRAVSGVFGRQGAATTLEDPGLKTEDQKRIIDERLAALKVQPMVANLLHMLVQRQRLALLPRIVESYQQLFNKEKGIVVADVTSAVPLDEAQQKRVVAELSKITGKSIELRVHQDPSILGGLITRIGDELIDSSVATRLSTLAQRLS
jgi:F-type H+-transporting ATPase subunit delta